MYDYTGVPLFDPLTHHCYGPDEQVLTINKDVGVLLIPEDGERSVVKEPISIFTLELRMPLDMRADLPPEC